MKTQNKLSRLSRADLAELICRIQSDNATLEKRCRKLERQLAELQQAKISPEVQETLDDMEDTLRVICRRMSGRRSGFRDAKTPRSE